MLKLTILKNHCNSCILSNGEVVNFTMSWYNQLLSEIRDWRLNKAHLINLPPYCIFPDKTLHSIINILPTSEKHLWLVSGFNEILINNYGKEIIEIMNSFFQDKDIIEILYSTHSFDLRNHKVKGILGFLGYLPLFSEEQSIIEEQPLIEKKTTKEQQKNQNHLSHISQKSIVQLEEPKSVELYDIFEVQFEDGDVLEAQIVEPVDITVFEETGRRDGSSRFYPKKIRVLNPENCFSSDTPFARAVLYNSINQYFSYTVENILIKGKIINIKKANKKDY